MRTTDNDSTSPRSTCSKNRSSNFRAPSYSSRTTVTCSTAFHKDPRARRQGGANTSPTHPGAGRASGRVSLTGSGARGACSLKTKAPRLLEQREFDAWKRRCSRQSGLAEAKARGKSYRCRRRDALQKRYAELNAAQRKRSPVRAMGGVGREDGKLESRPHPNPLPPREPAAGRGDWVISPLSLRRLHRRGERARVRGGPRAA